MSTYYTVTTAGTLYFCARKANAGADTVPAVKEMPKWGTIWCVRRSTQGAGVRRI